MGAEFAAFAPLAFIQTRPPWALERKPELADPRDPSPGVADGAASDDSREHVSERTRRRLAGGGVRGDRRDAGSGRCCCCSLAVAICVACVVGRYHYIVDIVAGAGRGCGCSGWRIDRPPGMDHNEIGWFPFQIHRRTDRVRAVLVVPARARAQQPGGGVIEGFVTTQSGTIRLGGAQVVAPQLRESGSRDGALGG